MAKSRDKKKVQDKKKPKRTLKEKRKAKKEIPMLAADSICIFLLLNS